MTELELRDLQLGALAVDDGPVLAPIELEGFTERKGRFRVVQRILRMFRCF
jgi:hypothetical protein